jgi:hypothetical protein
MMWREKKAYRYRALNSLEFRSKMDRVALSGAFAIITSPTSTCPNPTFLGGASRSARSSARDFFYGDFHDHFFIPEEP